MTPDQYADIAWYLKWILSFVAGIYVTGLIGLWKS